LVGVDDEERQASLGEVVSDRQTGLTTPDDEGLYVFSLLAHYLLAPMGLDSTTALG
jgi:hypothetical protein